MTSNNSNCEKPININTDFTAIAKEQLDSTHYNYEIKKCLDPLPKCNGYCIIYANIQ